jgi:putative Mn2+ efflux pump MntP
MEIWTIILTAFGLAMDAFAVSIAAGLAVPRVTGRHVFRIAWHFGLFQFLMPVIGWLAGRSLAGHIQAYDHWIAFGLLSFIGGKMLHEAFTATDEDRANRPDPTKGLTLVTLSVATSIDALAVGLSLALLGVDIWLPSVLIGAITCGLCAFGILFGARLGTRVGRAADVLGGGVLITIGLRILITHLLAG